jgi:hypothetical protein
MGHFDLETVAEARLVAETRLASMPRRLAHVRGVAAAASGLVAGLDDAQATAVVAASWLHDVGYAPSVKRTGFHPLDGAVFLDSAGWSREVVSLVAFHSGAAVEAELRGLSAQLAAFSSPSVVLLDAVTCADMTTSPAGEPVSVEGRLAEILSRYDAADPVHRAVSRSSPDLILSVRRCQDRLSARGRLGGQPR